MGDQSRLSVAEQTITVEVRLIANLTSRGGSSRYAERITVPAETTIGDLIERYQLPLTQIARVLCNGQDMNPGLYTGGNLDLSATVSDGDVITFSGRPPAIPRTSAVL